MWVNARVDGTGAGPARPATGFDLFPPLKAFGGSKILI